MWSYGEIVTARGEKYLTKPRPVLVIQNPGFFTGNSVLVAPLTSAQNEEIMTRAAVEPSKLNGLDRYCYVEVDKISAITTASIDQSIGQLEQAALAEVTALAISLISPA